MNVPKKTEVHKKPTRRMTRSQNVATTVDVLQPSVMANSTCRMRTRSQSSEKSANSVPSSSNTDKLHDATLDVTVSLLNMNIDGNSTYRLPPVEMQDDKESDNATTPKVATWK